MNDLKIGFHATSNETFFVTESDRIWIVSSPDFDGIREITREEFPADAIEVNDMMTADEAMNYMEQIQMESGEILIDGLNEALGNN